MQIQDRLPTRTFIVRGNGVIEVCEEDLVQVHPYVVYFLKKYEDFGRGHVLVFNHEQKVWHHFERLDEFSRACGHMLEGYGHNRWDEGEIALFERIRRLSLRANGEMLQWSKLPKVARDEYATRVREACADLPAPRKFDKVVLKGRLVKTTNAFDRRGRENWPAAAARLMGAEGNAVRLLTEMRQITRRVGDREIAVQRLIAEEEAQCRAFHGMLAGILSGMGQVPEGAVHSYFEDQLDDTIQKMGKRLFEPWRSAYRRSVEDDLTHALRFMRRGMPGETLKYLERVLLVLELLEFERMYVDLMRRAFLEMDRRPRDEKGRRVRELKLRQLREEFELMRSELEEEDGTVTIDRTLRSHVAQKFHRRSGDALVRWKYECDWSVVKERMRAADDAW